MQLTIKKADKLKPKPDDSELRFGTIFTDHMFNMDYNPEKGWHNPRIEPYGPISMDPSTMVLHYGQSIFEGLKAFRTDSEDIRLFRPQENFKRFNGSAHALCIPEFDEAFALDALKQLLVIEKDWVPKTSGTSLYIRPTIVAMDPFIGVRASHTYPVRGGMGEAKTAGNYAASLYAGEEAHKHGYTQVLWLDGVELKYIEEVGSMNIFFVIDDEIITPMLNGSILSGITRDSVISLAKKWGMKVTERRISINELINAYDCGKLQEAFGSGTAAVISPVGVIKYGDKVITIGDGNVGPVAHKFFKAITDIQYGKAEDSMGWIMPVEV